MTYRYTNDYVKMILAEQNCKLLANYVNNSTPVKYCCNNCGTCNSCKIGTLLKYKEQHVLFCRNCKQQNRNRESLENRIKERLHENKTIIKLTKHNVWLVCDHCHQVKLFNRNFLTKDYLRKHNNLCCKDCQHKKLLKSPDVYRKEFEQADKNHEYELLTDYCNSKTKVQVRHKVCGNIYFVIPNEFTLHGRRCPYCAGHVFTKSDFVKRQKKWSDDYKHDGLQPILFNPKPKKELWKSVNPYLCCIDYEISNWGRIRKISTKQIIKQRLNKQTGYYVVTLYNNQHRPKTIAVHRLVALSWLSGNSNNDPNIYVNHINEIQTDNWVTNLEWCDDKYNSNYGNARYRQISSIHKHVFTKVEQWDEAHTKLLYTYNSLRQASAGSGVSRNVIQRIAKDHKLNGSPYDFEIIK